MPRPASSPGKSRLESRIRSRGAGRARSLAVLAACVLAAPSASADAPHGGYVLVQAAQVGPRPAFGEAGRTVLFLNRDGGHYAHGWQDDSSQNLTSIVGFEFDVPAYPFGDDSWNQVLSCMRDLYADFDIEVTDVDPGEAPHMEVVIGGWPHVLGLPDGDGNGNGYGGIAPLGCGVVQNAVSFAFPETYGDNPAGICEAAGQESAHAFGLDHGFLCEDIMTYLVGCGQKRFVDQDVPCGELDPRACYCGAETQNSHQYLMDVLGPARADAPPSVEITQPEDGAVVDSTFGVEVEATDDSSIAEVELYVDGELVAEDDAPPWSFEIPPELADGSHGLEVWAHDDSGQVAVDRIRVEVEVTDEPTDEDGVDPGGDDDDGGDSTGDPSDEDALGAFGDACEEGDDCASNACARTGAGGGRFCTQECEDDDCPAGNVCTELDVGRYCLPEDGPSGAVGLSAGGCRAVPGAGDAGRAVLFALVAALATAFRRRA